MSRIGWVVVVVLSACGTEAVDAPCDPSAERCTLSHTLATYRAEGFEEIDGVCFSWTLNNAAPIWVNAVASENGGAFHHSNWFWVPDNRFDQPDGYWPCEDEGFNEIAAALFGGTLFAASTQTTAETQQFRPGAAIQLPPFARVVAYAHILNANEAPLDTHLSVTLSTVPEAEVTTRLAEFRLNIGDLNIAPMTRTEHTGDCNIGLSHQSITGEPLAMKLHYVLPHYHSLGDTFRLALSGGDRDGESLFSIEDTFGEPLGHTFDEPIDIVAAGATGLRFTCGWTNPRTEPVHFGIGDQEMCVMLGFADMDIKFEASVDDMTETTTAPDGTVHNSGPCQVNGTRVF